MAATQPDKKDLTVLQEGTPRSHVVAELGSAVHTEETEDGRMDVYTFVQGYSEGAKASRAVAHGIVDIFTLGLWEIIGTPIEVVADGTEVKLEIYYDENDTLKSITVLAGEDAIPSPEDAVASKEEALPSERDAIVSGADIMPAN